MKDKLLFFDLETTGLEIEGGAILEVAAAVVDSDLTVLDTYWNVVKHDVLKLNLNKWAQCMHTKSGLLRDVERAWKDLKTVEEELIQFVTDNFPEGHKIILCGNSIHFDRAWIKKYLPRFESLLHYRMIDVSGLCEALKVVKGVEIPRMQTKHRGMYDVNDSITLFKQLMHRVA